MDNCEKCSHINYQNLSKTLATVLAWLNCPFRRDKTSSYLDLDELDVGMRRYITQSHRHISLSELDAATNSKAVMMIQDHVGTRRGLFSTDEINHYTWPQTTVLFQVSLICAWSSKAGKSCNVCPWRDLSRNREEVYWKVNVVTSA
jgi:hypothetical protein